MALRAQSNTPIHAPIPPPLRGTSLYTREASRGDASIAPYIPLPIVIAYLKLVVGGVGDAAPGNLAVLQNLWFSVGADSISARGVLRLPQPYMLPKSRAIFPKLRTASL